MQRLDNACEQIQNKYTFPLDTNKFKKILKSTEFLAYCDQIIYRFSKLQDYMGAKLFKSVLLSQGENINKPFLDLLNNLEKIDVVNVDEWFEIRDLRNDIAHDYSNDEAHAIKMINTIYTLKKELSNILIAIDKLQ